MDLEEIGAHITLMCAAAASPERYRIHADDHAIRIKLGWKLAKLSDELAPKLAGLSDPKAIEQTLQEAINRIIKDAGLDSPLLNGQ